jgi:hypothetical protein
MGFYSNHKKIIYLPVITFLIGFFCAFIIFFNLSGEQKGKFLEIKNNKPGKSFVMKNNKPFYDPERLRQQTSSQGGILYSQRSERDATLVKKDIKGPVQGKVTVIDWCSRMVFLDDVPFDMGSLDLVGKIEMGNRVEVTYTDTRQGKVIESIQVLH